MYSNKFLFSLILSFLFLCDISVAQEDSCVNCEGKENFIRKGAYAKVVYYDNPETLILAKDFLKYGISATRHTNNSFNFEITDSDDKYTVTIWYRMLSQGFWINFKSGKYVYKKKNSTDEMSEFVNEFVPWMVRNAWPE